MAFIRKNKRIFTLLSILLIIGIAAVVYAADRFRGKTEFYDRATFKKDVQLDGEVTYGTDAEVVSTKNMYPQNWIKNSKLAFWSGGTCYANGSTAALPDGWYMPSLSTYTGATLVAVNTISPVSSVTPDFLHSMNVGVNDPTTGQSASTKFILYPGSGVSTASSWYKNFAGKSVTFGAWVNRPITQTVTSGITTNFIRPVINTHSIHLSGVTSGYWAQGDYVENSDWNLATVTMDVPNDASAFECGFAMNPTAIAPTGTSGDSAYIVAPFLLINPLHKSYVPIPDEEVFFTNQIDVFGAGGSTFGTGTSQALDISSDNGWGGKIPDDTESIYVTVAVDATYMNALHFYGDNSLGGVSFYGQGGSGVSIQTMTAWIPISSSGTINISDVSDNFTGTSLFVLGAKTL